MITVTKELKYNTNCITTLGTIIGVVQLIQLTITGSMGGIDQNLVTTVATTTPATAVSVNTENAQSNEYARKLMKKKFEKHPILIEIAMCESSGRHFNEKGEVLRGKVDNRDIGIMQINEFYHDSMAKKLDLDIHTIEGNLEYANVLYEKFGGQPWSASAPCWAGSNVIAMK